MAPKPKRKRCYLYLRVSTDMQIDGFSLEAQEERLRREAKYKEFDVVEVFADKGKSGKNTSGRPEFRRMMDRIANNNEDHVDYVFVFKLSRFGRNAADVLYNLQLMKDYGVNLRAVAEEIDSAGPSGNLMIPVIAAVSEIERENIREQTMAGRKQKARDGLWNGGQAPYGYMIQDGALVINEQEAEIVRIIFERYAYHSGISGVTKFLNESGYKRNLRGNTKYVAFTTPFVKRVLDNPVYVGKIAYGRRQTEKIPGTRNEFHMVWQDEYPVYDGKHDAIIDEDTWRDVRKKRKQTSASWEKVYSLEHEHILSGILRCPVCDAPMYGSVTRKRKKDGSFYKDGFYYVCKHRVKVPGGDVCNYKKQPPQDAINEEVIAALQAAYHSPTFAGSMQHIMNQRSDVDEIKARLVELRKSRAQAVVRKDKLANEIDNLDALDKNYDMMYDDLNNRLRNQYDVIANLDSLIEEAEGDLQSEKDAQATLEQAYGMLVEFADVIPEMTDAEKKALVKLFIDRVEIFPERTNGRYVKSIRFKFPVMIDGEEGTDWWYSETHDETVVQLYHQNISTPDRQFISVDYAPTDEEIQPFLSHSATYDEIKQWVWEHYETKVSTLYIAQVKQKHGLIERECYNMPKSENPKKLVVPPYKERMIEDALRHLRVIK